MILRCVAIASPLKSVFSEQHSKATRDQHVKQDVNRLSCVDYNIGNYNNNHEKNEKYLVKLD